MLLDELPPELLSAVYSHLPGDRLWTDVRQICRRFNHTLRRNDYWLRRASELYGMQLPRRLKQPPQQAEEAQEEGTSAENGLEREQLMPSLRCIAVERAAARWATNGTLDQRRARHCAEAHVGTIDALRMFRVSGRRFCLSGARDRQIALWDLDSSGDSGSRGESESDGGLSTSVRIRIQDAHKGWIWCLAVVPGAEHFYSAGWDSLIQQWHMTESAIRPGVHLSFGQLAVLGCVTDGPYVLYASTYRQGPLLFDLRAGTQAQRQLSAHGERAVFEMATGLDCSQIFSIGEDNRLVAVDKRQFEVLNSYQAPVSHVDYASGQLCLSTRPGHLLFFNPSTLELENKLVVSQAEESGSSSPSTSWGHNMIRLTRGATFYCSSSDNRLRVYTPGLRPRLLAYSAEPMASSVTRLDVLGSTMMAAFGTGSLTFWPDD